jgi:hypothetical protein
MTDDRIGPLEQLWKLMPQIVAGLGRQEDFIVVLPAGSGFVAMPAKAIEPLSRDSMTSALAPRKAEFCERRPSRSNGIQFI